MARIMTAATDQARPSVFDKVLGLEMGGDGYMTKPLRKSDLHMMIRTHAPQALGKIRGLMAANRPAPG